MAALNLTLDVPYETENVNISALKADLIAFAKVLLSSPSLVIPKSKKAEADPFAELDTSWGGNRDADDIAEELHAIRVNTSPCLWTYSDNPQL